MSIFEYLSVNQVFAGLNQFKLLEYQKHVDKNPTLPITWIIIWDLVASADVLPKAKEPENDDALLASKAFTSPTGPAVSNDRDITCVACIMASLQLIFLDVRSQEVRQVVWVEGAVS